MNERFIRILKMKYSSSYGRFDKGNRFSDVAMILAKATSPIVNCFVLEGNIHTNEYLQVSSVTVTGEVKELIFTEGATNEYIQLSSITATGTLGVA